MTSTTGRRAGFLTAWAIVALGGAVSLRALAQQAPPAPQGPEPVAPVSASAQRIYQDAQPALLQVRTLLKGQDSQASVGSGFFVSGDGHIITNYHVVSEVALQPERFRLVYRTAQGAEGALKLLAFDAIHDLALVKPVDSPGRPHTSLRFRPEADAVGQGERIYSLGNPLDVGFAVVEGTYNGLVERAFYPTIFFAGSLNPGVSGGPTLDERGQVIGINVASRRDGQQVSFLVPAKFAADLFQRAHDATPITTQSYPELTRQLTVHQQSLTDRFLAQSWRSAGHARYLIPVPQEEFMRCWGSSTPADAKGLEFERSDCVMETRLFVSEWLTTGSLMVRHEAYDGRKLGLLRFADRYSRSFANEALGGAGNKVRTAQQCHESYVDRNGLPLRVVLCMSEYKKLTGLFDAAVLVATVDASNGGVEGRFDADGVTFDNALKLTAHYLEGFGWASQQSTSAR